VRKLDERTILEVIRTGRFPDGSAWNPLQTVLVESDREEMFPPATAGDAEITLYEPNRVYVKTTSDTPSILVLGENHYPGWRAKVDGQSVDVMRVNYNQRGIALPAGNHLVTFVYWPKSVLIGLVISLLTLAALVVWSIGFSRRLVRAADAPEQ
jgi:hypothetical protein